MVKRGHMKKRCALFMTVAFFALVAPPVFAEDEQGDNQPKVVADDEPCPSGRVVSGLTGGQGDISKVCVPPNSATMPNDTDEVG